MKLDFRIWEELKARARGDGRMLVMWRAYIDFLQLRPSLEENAPDTAVHHILWRSEYLKYEDYKWNLIRLSFEDHIAAAALMLAAEPNNLKLINGFHWTFKNCAILRRWKPKNPKEIIRLYKTHSTLKQIAKRFGVCQQAVSNFLRRNKVRIRTSAEIKRWKPKNPNTVIHLYTKGNSMEALAAKYGKAVVTVRNFLLRSNVKIRSRAGMRGI